MTVHTHDPLVSSPRVKGRSIFTIIGFIVVALIALVVLYYAWIGWNARGKPVPEVKTTTTMSDPVPSPAAVALRRCGTRFQPVSNHRLEACAT